MLSSEEALLPVGGKKVLISSLVIVDCECANLSSVYKAARMVKLDPVVSGDPRVIASATALIFPGVGSFAHAAALLDSKNIRGVLLDAIASGKTFLGICLGMQLLFASSEEKGPAGLDAAGLDLIPGQVKRFPGGLPVPHVGWNRAQPLYNHPLFEGLSREAYFYFTHSYYVQPDSLAHSLAVTDYGFQFNSAVINNNLLGVQFHPEKSGPAGLRLLSNFGNIIADHC